MSIIGVSGKIGSGKDTVGQIVNYLTTGGKEQYESIEGFLKYYNDGIEQYSWKIKKYAGKLKQIGCLILGCTMEDWEDREFKNKELGEEWTKYQIWKFGLVTAFRPHDWQLYSNKYFNTEDEAKVYWKERSDSYNKHPLVMGSMTELEENTEVRPIKLTPRTFLQLLGTDCGRNLIHPNIWVNSMFTNYKPEYGCDDTCDNDQAAMATGQWCIEPKYCLNKIYPNWLITDVRFPNEVQAIKDRNGIVIRVKRELPKIGVSFTLKDGTVENHMMQEHPSETALDNHKDWDYIIDNNSSIEDLIDKVKVILEQEKIL